jgi:hypothetical protein
VDVAAEAPIAQRVRGSRRLREALAAPAPVRRQVASAAAPTAGRIAAQLVRRGWQVAHVLREARPDRTRLAQNLMNFGSEAI